MRVTIVDSSHGYSDELAHYGVKGMKWGKHLKAKDYEAAIAAAQKKKYASDRNVSWAKEAYSRDLTSLNGLRIANRENAAAKNQLFVAEMDYKNYKKTIPGKIDTAVGSLKSAFSSAVNKGSNSYKSGKAVVQNILGNSAKVTAERNSGGTLKNGLPFKRSYVDYTNKRTGSGGTVKITNENRFNKTKTKR